MKVLRGRTRIAAGAGLAVAAAATAVLAIVAGPAQAVERGKCTDTVNVRERPSPDAPVVAKCKAGTMVSIDKRKNDFVHLTSPDGWASADFVKTTSASGQPSSAVHVPQRNTTPAPSPADRKRSGASGQTPAPGPAGAPQEQNTLADLAPGLLR